jgi:hypothetical protein
MIWHRRDHRRTRRGGSRFGHRSTLHDAGANAFFDHVVRALLFEMAFDPLDRLGLDRAHMISNFDHTDRLE